MLKGWIKGLIVGIFSLLAFIAGLAAALKLSALLTLFIKNSTGFTALWMPVISFVLIFSMVVLLVNLGAKIIKKTISFAMLGWVDRIGGIIFYLVIYATIFSVILFLAGKTWLIKPESIAASILYDYLAPWGQKVISHTGKMMTVFKDLFMQIQSFFEKTGNKFAV